LPSQTIPASNADLQALPKIPKTALAPHASVIAWHAFNNRSILFRPFRAPHCFVTVTQGVALGWHVAALQAAATLAVLFDS
jgi:hypothetical protein